MTENQWVKEGFEAGDLPLSGGDTLYSARLHYHQIGQLNAPKDNLILLPTYYGGAAEGNHPWVAPGSPLDPGEYCIVIPALLGAGESSSPSNTPGLQAGAGFPAISLYDNVMLQKRLVDEVFGGASLALVMGWSMGGMQALQWGCLFPEQVRAVLATCCTARCYPHNRVFLEGVKAALTCDQSFQEGHYQQPPERGLRAFGRVYAGWAYSQAFFATNAGVSWGSNPLKHCCIAGRRTTCCKMPITCCRFSTPGSRAISAITRCFRAITDWHLVP